MCVYRRMVLLFEQATQTGISKCHKSVGFKFNGFSTPPTNRCLAPVLHHQTYIINIDIFFFNPKCTGQSKV